MGSGRSVYGADGDNEFSAIAILGKYAYIALHDYMDQKRAGIVEPEFDPAILPSQRGIEVWKKK